MPRQHPTVQVPNIGPMDHAWDLLGEWQAEFELPETESPVHGKVTFSSWTDAELQLDPIEAAIAGIPSSVPLERASEIHLTDAGGGALQWVLHAPSTNWSLQATLWPGSLHLFVHDADDDEEQLYRARATRDQDYYLEEVPARHALIMTQRPPAASGGRISRFEPSKAKDRWKSASWSFPLERLGAESTAARVELTFLHPRRSYQTSRDHIRNQSVAGRDRPPHPAWFTFILVPGVSWRNGASLCEAGPGRSSVPLTGRCPFCGTNRASW